MTMIDKNSSVCVNCITLAVCINKTNKRLVRDCKNLSAVLSVNAMDQHLTSTHFYGLERKICSEMLSGGVVIIRGINLTHDY